MADNDTAAIREMCEPYGYYDNNPEPILALCTEVEDLRARLAEVEWAEMLTGQSCPKDKHPDWFIDSEHNHPCPWCRIAEVEAERDELDGRFENLANRAEGYLSRAEKAEARLAAVETERDGFERRLYERTGRLAAVLALCDEAAAANDIRVSVEEVRAVARGEGDRPADGRHEFVLRTPDDPFFPSACGRGSGSLCGETFDHPIHSGEGDR